MLTKLTISSLLILFSAVFAVPNAIAQEEPNDTRIEKYEDLTETEDVNASEDQSEGMEEMQAQDGAMEPNTRTEETMMEAQSSDSQSGYDVRRTEAFNLVSSGYRGDFEDQGINSYAVFEGNYESGELTAEDLIAAAIDAGELSPAALEDDAYIQAVDSQLSALTTN